MNTYYSLKNSSLLEAIHPSSTSPQKSIESSSATGSTGEAPLPASFASPVSTDRRSQCLDALVDPPGRTFAYSTAANVPLSVLGEPQAAMEDSSSYYHYLACSTDPEATKLMSNRDVEPASLRLKSNGSTVSLPPTSSIAIASTGNGNVSAGGFPSYSSQATSAADATTATAGATAGLLDPIESSVLYWWLDELGQPQPMPTSTSAPAGPAHMYMYHGAPFVPPPPSQMMASSIAAHQGSKSAPPAPGQSFFYPQAQHALMPPFHTRASTPSSASAASSVASQGSHELMTNAGANDNGYPRAPSSPSPSLSTASPLNAVDEGVVEQDKPLRKRTYKKMRLTDSQKRDNHLASEQKRRGHYKQAIENLVSILPKPGHGEADRSQCHLIWRAVHFIRSLEQSNQSLAYQLQQPLMMAPSPTQGNAPHGNGSGRPGGSFITM